MRRIISKMEYPISDEERAKRKKGIDSARANVRLEGTILPPEIELINQRFIDGEIDIDEYVRLGLEAAESLRQR